jgi:hypothetical protein
MAVETTLFDGCKNLRKLIYRACMSCAMLARYTGLLRDSIQ